MSKEWTLENAVKKFKPEKMKSLNRNKGNLNTREIDSLIKEIKRYYEEAEVKGTGRNRIIFTDKKRKEMVDKEDKRHFNKGIAPPHSKHLALMIMSKMDIIDDKARTIKGWATYFGLISSAERDILDGIYSKERLKPYKEMMIRLGIIKKGEEEIFQDLADILLNVGREQLLTAIAQAEKLELIRRVCSWKGKVKDSDEHIDIDKATANEINNVETALLKKYEISKRFSIMCKNSPKTKAYKTEWLDYIENVEDAEGNSLQLQYIYEVFQIEVLDMYAFLKYIEAHYPSEVNSFNLLENEQAYHDKLLEYVTEKAQKRYFKKLESKKINFDEMDEFTKEIVELCNMTEEDIIRQIELNEEIDIWRQPEYKALVQTDRYVDNIKELHTKLHSMKSIESEEDKATKYWYSEHRKERAQAEIPMSGRLDYDL